MSCRRSHLRTVAAGQRARGMHPRCHNLVQPAGPLGIKLRQAAEQLRSLGFKGPCRGQYSFGMPICHDPTPAAVLKVSLCRRAYYA